MIKEKIRSCFSYIFLIVASIISIFPLVWMLISATNTRIDIIRGKLSFGVALLDNAKKLFTTTNAAQCFWNSLRNATCLTILSLLICSLAGYAFELFHDKWKDRVMSILLLSMMVPFAATMIPLFTWMGNMDLINTTLGFALPSVASAFLIFLFRQSARSFPYEIVEAARMEGMSELGIFFKVFIPVMKSTYTAAITVTFMGAWNSFLWPLIILQKPESRTMPILINNLIAGYVIDYGELMFTVLISTLPTIIIFFILQKNFAEGVTGAVK